MQLKWLLVLIVEDAESFQKNNALQEIVTFDLVDDGHALSHDSIRYIFKHSIEQILN